MPPSSTMSNIPQQAQCMSSKAEGKTICVKYCQTSQCNHQDIRLLFFFSLFKRKKHVLNIDFVSVLAMALWPLQSIE